MNEYDTIRAIAAQFRRSPDQLNGLFECDAELVRIRGETWGLTMDDFSPDEDLFTSESPVLLGANLAVATLSDLFAAGVEPRFFMHAVSVPRERDATFVRELADGIRGVLDKAGCFLCGGDFGTAPAWRYCGFAMGPVASAQPLTHRIPNEPQTLWVTGTLGDANLAAFQKGPTPSFELRQVEAQRIRQYGTACMDTSGGLMDAVWILHELNPTMSFKIHADKIPLAPGLRAFAKATGIPAAAALLGGAGEYELLFTTPRDLSAASRAELRDLGMTDIGELTLSGTPGVHIHRDGRTLGTMTVPPPCPRAASDVDEHAQAVVKMAVELFGRD